MSEVMPRVVAARKVREDGKRKLLVLLECGHQALRSDPGSRKVQFSPCHECGRTELPMLPNNQPDPYSRRLRGLRHAQECPSELSFYRCLACHPGATLCPNCGHVQVEGGHGRTQFSEAGPLLLEVRPCGAREYGDCDCTEGVQRITEVEEGEHYGTLDGYGPTPRPMTPTVGTTVAGEQRRRDTPPADRRRELP